jgi:hypothetical protein
MSTSVSLHTLVRTKIQVLEIIWSYLSNGREPQAWSELADMWPPADLDRIRGAIQDARARAILHQVDGVQRTGQGRRENHQAKIFDCTKLSNHESYADSPTAHLPSLNGAPIPTVAEPDAAETNRSLVDSRPEPINIGVPLSDTQKRALPDTNSQINLNLVVDAAGKVQSAQLANTADHGPIGDTVLSASADWKFIPAFANGRAVACHTVFGVWPKQ